MQARVNEKCLEDGGGQLKVNSRCFWNACKALSFGLLLMVIGAMMATIGYYAEQLSEDQELRGNVTVRVKHETRGFHLNNLSYAGPIVMGCGGFIVVAACVMTFEARDSAAKVVPSRSKSSCQRKPTVSGSMRGQSIRSDVTRAGSVRGSPDRRALTQAFMQFSKRLDVERESGEMTKSPSAPDLQAAESTLSPSRRHSPRKLSPRSNARLSRVSLTPVYLSPHALLYRQALSVDDPGYAGFFSSPRISRQSTRDSRTHDENDHHHTTGSQASMVMDIHVAGDGPTTVRVKDKMRRSELSRKHMFTRQNQVEEEDLSENYIRRDTSSASPRLPSYYDRDGFNTLGLDIHSPKSRSTPHSRRESIAKARSGGSADEATSIPDGSPCRRASSASCSRRASVRQDSRRASADSRRLSGDPRLSRRPSSQIIESRRPSGQETIRPPGSSERRRGSYYSKSGASSQASQETASTRVASSTIPTPEEHSMPSTSTLRPPSFNFEP